jgi:hypothetical protein
MIKSLRLQLASWYLAFFSVMFLAWFFTEASRTRWSTGWRRA